MSLQREKKSRNGHHKEARERLGREAPRGAGKPKAEVKGERRAGGRSAGVPDVKSKKQSRMMAREAAVPVNMFTLPPGTHPNDKANRERVAQVVRRMTGCGKVAVRLARGESGQTLTDTYYVAPGDTFVSLAGLDDDQAELVADIIDGIAQDEDVSVELEDLADTVEETDEEGDSKEDADPASDAEDDEEEDDEEFDPEEQFRSSRRSRRRTRAYRKNSASLEQAVASGSPVEGGADLRDIVIEEPLGDGDYFVYIVDGVGGQETLYEGGDESAAMNAAAERGRGYNVGRVLYEDEYGDAVDISESMPGGHGPPHNRRGGARRLAEVLGVSPEDASLIAKAIRGKRAKEARRILYSGEGLPFKVRTAGGEPYTLREVGKLLRMAVQRGDNPLGQNGRGRRRVRAYDESGAPASMGGDDIELQVHPDGGVSISEVSRGYIGRANSVREGFDWAVERSERYGGRQRIWVFDGENEYCVYGYGATHSIDDFADVAGGRLGRRGGRRSEGRRVPLERRNTAVKRPARIRTKNR